MLEFGVCVCVGEAVRSWGLWTQICVNPSSLRILQHTPGVKSPHGAWQPETFPDSSSVFWSRLWRMLYILVLGVCLCDHAISSSTACVHRHLQQKWVCQGPRTWDSPPHCISHPTDMEVKYRHVFHIASHVSYHLCRLMQCNQQFNMLLVNALIILFLSDTAITRFLCFDAESSKTLN